MTVTSSRFVVALDERVEPVLRRQRFVHLAVGRQQTGADNAPAERVGAHLHQVVRVAGHMRAMKSAETQMNNAGRHTRQIVARHAYT